MEYSAFSSGIAATQRLPSRGFDTSVPIRSPASLTGSASGGHEPNSSTYDAHDPRAAPAAISTGAG